MERIKKLYQSCLVAADYLERFPDFLDSVGIFEKRAEQELRIREGEEKYLTAAEGFIFPETELQILDNSVVSLGGVGDLTAADDKNLLEFLCLLKPWRKGPFQVFGHAIDGEWRSDWKWERIERKVGSLQGLRIADIGCNNGYFMFRMAAQKPDLVVGFEPVLKNFVAFSLLQRIARCPQLYFEMLGVEDIDLYPKFFDRIFCLGILYHHTDPIGILKKMLGSLADQGVLIVDCQGIAGDESVALVPKNRYGGARGFWFLPTRSCLQNWLRRAGFSRVEFFYDDWLSVEEQRRTEWAPTDSLAESLDPQDPQKTKEGYPAPKRFYCMARR